MGAVDYRGQALAVWTQSQATSTTIQRAVLRGRVKTVICRIIAALPSRWWPLASEIVRRIWPKGMRDA
jgi:hypothetical protein